MIFSSSISCEYLYESLNEFDEIQIINNSLNCCTVESKYFGNPTSSNSFQD